MNLIEQRTSVKLAMAKPLHSISSLVCVVSIQWFNSWKSYVDFESNEIIDNRSTDVCFIANIYFRYLNYLIRFSLEGN